VSWARSKEREGWGKEIVLPFFSKEVKQMNSNIDLNSTKQNSAPA
jgi:hypothetical protein